MLDPARRDDQAVDAGRVEHEAKRGLGDRLLPLRRRLTQPFDRGEAIFVEIVAVDVAGVRQPAAGRRLLAQPVFAGQQSAGERTEGGVAKAVLRAARYELV